MTEIIIKSYIYELVIISTLAFPIYCFLRIKISGTDENGMVRPLRGFWGVTFSVLFCLVPILVPIELYRTYLQFSKIIESCQGYDYVIRLSSTFESGTKDFYPNKPE
jgi:hypothetical protein